MYYFGRASEVFFAFENGCARIAFLKIQKKFRRGAAKAVDTLILVAHHKNIAVAVGEQLYDKVLNF